MVMTRAMSLLRFRMCCTRSKVRAIRTAAATQLREPDKLKPVTTDTTAIPAATTTGIHNLELVVMLAVIRASYSSGW
jgi:hypothetical protein